MRTSRPKNHALLPVVKAIIGDVGATSKGVRIPKDKFMMWIMMLRRQQLQNIRVFYQLGCIAVEFAKNGALFVSDQFLILAAVGLSPATIGEMISPTLAETKVAVKFLMKYQERGASEPATNPGIVAPRRNTSITGINRMRGLRSEQTEPEITVITPPPPDTEEFLAFEEKTNIVSSTSSTISRQDATNVARTPSRRRTNPGQSPSREDTADTNPGPPPQTDDEETTSAGRSENTRIERTNPRRMPK